MVISKVASEARRVKEILKILKREYPDAQCSLDYKNAFQLLVSTILAAQCTDERVNKVTPALFKKFPTPAKMAEAKISELEALIRSTGFYKNKALSLKNNSQLIVEQHRGKVPGEMDQLIELPGVGRKTANVVLSHCFDYPALVVDTHVGRVSRRLGLTSNDDPAKVETDLMKQLPKEEWTGFSHLLISHGRAICIARRPKCEECPVAKYCPKIGVSLPAETY